MTAFLVCFIFTPIFTYFAQKNFKKSDNKSRILSIVFSVIAILIPSIIAGVRDLTVGRDIGVYVTPTIESALNSGFWDYMTNSTNEIGYSLLIYIITIFTDNVHVSLFIIQLLTITFIYLFAYKKRDKLQMWFVILIYLLSWYCISYTMMRQSIAVAIIIFSTVFFERKKYVKTALLFLLAMSFHVTAVLGILVYFIMYIYSGKFSKKTTNWMTAIILVCLVIATLFYKELLYFLTNIVNILPDRFYTYSLEYTAGKLYTNYSELLYKLFWIASAVFYMVKTRKMGNNAKLTLMLLLIDFATFIVSWKIVNIGRAGYYFFYLAMFNLLPEITNLYKEKSKKKVLIYIAFILVLFVFWYWKFPVNSYSDTYPYTSNILPFLK